MGFLDRAKMAFGLDGAEAREERQERSERDEQWGRITAIKSKVGPAVTVEVTIYGGRQTQTATIMSVALRQTKHLINERRNAEAA